MKELEIFLEDTFSTFSIAYNSKSSAVTHL